VVLELGLSRIKHRVSRGAWTPVRYEPVRVVRMLAAVAKL
jgi:hypothetical protein